jgi:cytochrome c oxidase assembly protein Cox11
MIESRETFELVKEEGEWRVLFDWAGGIKVTFHASLPPYSGIEARLSEREVIARPGEPFQITLKVKNRGRRPALVRVGHVFEPKEIAEHVELIMCGLLAPFELWPGSEREFSSAYFLAGGIEDPVRRLAITYEFESEE